MKPYHGRTRARSWVLQLLYAWEVSEDGSLARFAEKALQHRLVSPRYRPYMNQLIAVLDDKFAQIDAVLADHIPNWRIERLAAIDRNILRIGVAELLYVEKIPGKVAITEALHLAERYGSDDSSAFVNGVLDSVYRDGAIPG